jgi:hypothetical protein
VLQITRRWPEQENGMTTRKSFIYGNDRIEYEVVFVPVKYLLLPPSPKPQRLATLQVASHSQKFLFLAQVDFIYAHCRSLGFRRPAQRSRYRRSIDRTVLAASLTCLVTRRAAALSQASPTASSNRLLKGTLLGSCATFSVFTPQSCRQHGGIPRRWPSLATKITAGAASMIACSSAVRARARLSLLKI